MLDRLCFVGSNGMGTLIYEPAVIHPSETYLKDIGAIEYADHLIAKDAGVNSANSKLIDLTITKIIKDNF